MNSRPTSPASVLASIALMVSGLHSADATELGFYFGGYYGQVSKDSSAQPFDEFTLGVHDFFQFVPSETTRTFDDEHSAFGVVAGYRFTPHVAIEGAYQNLGKVAYRSHGTGNFPRDAGTLTTNIDSETTGFSASVLGILPLGYRWELWARGSVLFATNELKILLAPVGEEFVAVGGTSTSDSFSKSSTDYLAGVGGSFIFYDIYALRLEYQRVFSAGVEETGGVGDIDQISLGFVAMF